MQKTIRLGTRGSPLALIQAEEVKKRLITAHPEIGRNAVIEIVPIRTTGDWKPEHKERSFIELGGNKGLFTKEIEEALLSSHIDMAVHSMKDVASSLPDNLEIAAILERLDPRDAFIGRQARTLDELPKGATVGTSSLRRQSQLLAHRPDLRIVPLRGNVDTRLKKLADGFADATLLAVAGLMRLDMLDRLSSIMSTDVMLPAAAQGAIGIEIRKDDAAMQEWLKPLNAPDTFICIATERALLKALDGSCHTPIGVFAKIAGDKIALEVKVARANGTSLFHLTETTPRQDAESFATEIGLKLKAQLPPDIFSA